ncbi:MAG: response regulator [Anaerolineales bacterium]|nr:response regulator [Anaerolineales bacterium]
MQTHTLRFRLYLWLSLLTTVPAVTVMVLVGRESVRFWPLLVFIVGITLILAFLGAYLLAKSIERLTHTARAIVAGDFSVRAEEADREDEIGELARGLNEIAHQQIESIQWLEQRVQDRTAQLLTTAEVSRKIAALRDSDELIPLIVNIIHERFGFYFVGILLKDELNQAVVMKAAAGHASTTRVLQQEQLEIGSRSIIGWVAANNQVRIVKDVNTDPYFKPNPLLPDTRSEIAIPLRRQDTLIGVLDIQANSYGEFDDGDVQSLQGLADLITIALDNARLFEQSKEYARDMAQAREIAEDASRSKTQFLANMSHELRTPMNAIIGFSQVMQRDPTLTVKQREYLDIISRNSDHLLDLINDVLEMSKIEAGRTKLNETAFDLHHLLNDLRDLFQLRAEAKNLQMHFGVAGDVPRYVFGDDGKLRQVLINLLGNAIKFTHTGGISVRVGYEEAEIAPRLHFAVEDTGEGIAENELEKLFQPFIQTASGERSQEGTGLGLAISRQFIHLLGGEISVQSNLQRGTVIQFDIQVVLATEKDVKQNLPFRRVVGLAPEADGSLPNYRMLVVDDRETNRLLLREWLEAVGFEVSEAENGREALQIWEEWQPQLVWMDMRMPVMDGYETTRLIKSTVKGQATAVIALTASALEHERSLVLSAGCDDFVRKPVREAVVFEKIAEHLGVSYIYEDIEPFEEPQTEEVTADGQTSIALANLPQEWLSRLQQAAEHIDIDSANHIIDQIKGQDAELASVLHSLVISFRFDMLQALLHEAQNE